MDELQEETWLGEQRRVAAAYLEKQGIAEPELGDLLGRRSSVLQKWSDDESLWDEEE